jgi:hypothetical protein
MARSRSRGKSGGGGGRNAQAKSRKEAPAKEAAVEVVEEGGGLGIDDGIVIVTAILFLAACLLLDKEMAGNYGSGWIF